MKSRILKIPAAPAVLAVLLLIGAFAIGGQPPGWPNRPPPPILLGGIVQVDTPWGDAIARGMRLGAAEANAKIEIRRHHLRFDLERRYVEELTAEKVDGLVLVPLVDEASGYLLGKARAAGIPVVCISGCLTERDNARIASSFYESDDFELGYRIGTYVVEWTDRHPELFPGGPDNQRKVKVAIVHSDVFTVSYLRGRGFRQAFADAGVELDDSLGLQAIGIAQGAAAARSVALEERGVHLIWTDNSENTLGALRALQELPPAATRDLYLFGTDINREMAAALLDPRGLVEATAGQSTCKMAKEATLAAARIARGEETGGYRHVVLESRIFGRNNPESVRDYLAKASGGPEAEPCD